MCRDNRAYLLSFGGPTQAGTRTGTACRRTPQGHGPTHQPVESLGARTGRSTAVNRPVLRLPSPNRLEDDFAVVPLGIGFQQRPRAFIPLVLLRACGVLPVGLLALKGDRPPELACIGIRTNDEITDQPRNADAAILVADARNGLLGACRDFEACHGPVHQGLLSHGRTGRLGAGLPRT